MGIKKKKSVKPKNINVKLTRKQQRKQKRKEKKIRRNEYYTNRKKPGKFVLNSNKELSNFIKQHEDKTSKDEKQVDEIPSLNKVLTTEQLRNKEKKEQQKIQKGMIKQRSKQLLEANVEEDRNIKQLEKQLKLNKRKSKTLPKKFAEDGLDYLLEVCDSETVKSTIATEQELNEVNEEFEEDFALMTGSNIKEDDTENFLSEDSNDEDNSDEGKELDTALEQEEYSDEYLSESEDDSGSELTLVKSTIDDRKNKKSKKIKPQEMINKSKLHEMDNPKFAFNDHWAEKSEKTKNNLKKEIVNVVNKKAEKRKSKDNTQNSKKSKLNSSNSNSVTSKDKNELSNNEEESDISKLDDSDFDIDSNSSDQESETEGVANTNGTWEDIYGRLRAKDGSILNKTEEKYIPPAVRAKLELTSSEDEKRLLKLTRLKKQLKGLLNRLAESNMHSIASQIEDLYMNNSRNDMNDTLTNLMMESLISEVVAPERLLIEHVVLITILHANVGTEVGAHFLQCVIKKFHEYLLANHDIENKMMDNSVNVISQLYNFKLFEARLLYEILGKLSNTFGEKDIECILHILKSVGFTLRKDDPLSLKNLILDLQKRAANASEAVRDNPRLKFMLDILLAIKNNNVSKIPNYDTSYSEHLKKVMKGFIRKGNYVTQLNISLEDLLNAEQRGKWWVVGSAWTGNAPENCEKDKKTNTVEGFSTQLLELARKQRMNTDVRRNIFCIIMSAEDYLDAFEKLLRLGLKNQQDREIINIILQCCLQEKVYNPYYAVLAQKFCEYDRRYQMTIKYSVWDKLKSLNVHSGSQISNLAKLLTHLFLEKGLPISTLKIVQFSELDKVTLRFIRQILLRILLHKEIESCLSVFEKVSQSDKLKLFRESLRLFIHHFLLRNLDSQSIPEDQKSLLEDRAKVVEKLLVSKEGKMKF